MSLLSRFGRNRFSPCGAMDDVVSSEVIDSRYRELERLTKLSRPELEAMLWENMGLDAHANPGLVYGGLMLMIRTAKLNTAAEAWHMGWSTRDADGDDGPAGVLARVPA